MSDEKLDAILAAVKDMPVSMARLEERFTAHLREHNDLRQDHEAIAKEVLAHDKAIAEAKTTIKNFKWLAGATGISGPLMAWIASKWSSHG